MFIRFHFVVVLDMHKSNLCILSGTQNIFFNWERAKREAKHYVNYTFYLWVGAAEVSGSRTLCVTVKKKNRDYLPWVWHHKMWCSIKTKGKKDNESHLTSMGAKSRHAGSNQVPLSLHLRLFLMTLTNFLCNEPGKQTIGNDTQAWEGVS